MTIGPVHDQLGRDIARHEGREEGRRAGRDEGRREMLWLMAVGAAVADALYDMLDEVSYEHGWGDKSWAAHRMKHIALQALADLDDERALLGGE
jgi:hypothetical protein